MYTNTYLLNPFRSVFFGQSLVIRLQPELMSGLDLYTAVWNHMKRFVRNGPAAGVVAAASAASSRAASPALGAGAAAGDDGVADSDDSDGPEHPVKFPTTKSTASSATAAASPRGVWYPCFTW